jgi:hypothetical protein
MKEKFIDMFQTCPKYVSRKCWIVCHQEGVTEEDQKLDG